MSMMGREYGQGNVVNFAEGETYSIPGHILRWTRYGTISDLSAGWVGRNPDDVARESHSCVMSEFCATRGWGNPGFDFS